MLFHALLKQSFSLGHDARVLEVEQGKALSQELAEYLEEDELVEAEVVGHHAVEAPKSSHQMRVVVLGCLLLPIQNFGYEDFEGKQDYCCGNIRF